MLRLNNLLHCYFLVLVSSFCFTLCGSLSSNRGRRRVVAGDEYMTPTEVSRECCGRTEWKVCCSSPVDDLQMSCQDCSRNVTDTLDKLLPSCPYSKAQKKEARSLYCDNLIALSKKFLNDVQQKIQRYASCAIPHQSPSRQLDKDTYRSVDQIEKNVNKWYNDFRNRHKKWRNCCGNKTLPETKEKTLVLEINPRDCPQNFAKALDDFKGIQMYAQFVEKLGRRVKCLRGCVASDSMECAKSLYEHMVPPTETATESTDATEPNTQEVTYQAVENTTITILTH